jgi:hypothetical protein
MLEPVERLPGFAMPMVSGRDWWVLFTTSFREYGLLGPADWLGFSTYTQFLLKHIVLCLP